MARQQEPDKHHGWTSSLRRLFTLNIRSKIILPYLILTLSIAVIGTYVVTRLVASSLDERLTNQLLEAAHVVLDGLARQEINHLESARSVAFTVGVAEAVQAGDRDQVVELTQPTAAVRGVEALIIVDAKGQEVLHMLQHDDGLFEFVDGQFATPELWMVRSLLEGGDPNALPIRGLVKHAEDPTYYYLTAIPVSLDDRMVGVAVVGTSLDTLLRHFKTTSLADVIIYLDGGRAVATTFTSPDEAALLETFSTTPALYESALYNTRSTIGENVHIRGRWYRLVRGPLRVGDDVLGVFAVVLSSQFIVHAGTTSRNTYALILSAAMAGAILIGYLISQRITRPLSRLVRTSQAVAEGNLEQRTGIVGTDEIGMLAETFDEMTGCLSERTRALEEAIGRMRAILSSIGDGVVLEDLERKLYPLNAAAEILLEEMADNFALGPLRELSVEDYGQIPDLTPSPWLLERRRFKAGKKVISAHSAAVQTDNGEHLGTVIVLRDVTLEATAAKALEEEAEQRRAILSSISDAVVVLDLQKNVILKNQSAEVIIASLAAASEEDPIRRLWRDLALDQPTPGPIKGFRVDLDGQVIEALSSPVQTEDGARLGYVIVMRDITETIHAAEMATRISYLEELDQQKTEFISVASHELQSPLASAKTFTQNLLDGVYGEIGEDQAGRLEIVLDRINDEILLVNSLLDYSRLEAQPRPLILQPTDIAAIARGIVQEFKPRADRKGITLVAGSLDTETVPIDKRKIWRVLSNLLDNALKFTPTGGQVMLSVKSKSEVVEIQVADTGIGIPADQLEQIFDKFYQLDSSTTREFGGMGLGLAIAREIVKMHGGDIWAESQSGQGSVFFITLPKVCPASSEGEHQSHEQA